MVASGADTIQPSDVGDTNRADDSLLRDMDVVEARFRDVLESTPDGIVMANPSGHIVYANGQAERLFGYDPGELRGTMVETLLPQRSHDAHVHHRSEYFSQPRTRAMGAGLELFGRRKDGTEFPVEISLSPLHMDGRALVMSAIRDITERRRIEQTLREKNLELESASRAKDRFLATMSHELRTPLNAVIGFTGTLLMRIPGPLTPDQEKQLQIVQSSARHLLSLINDLLDLAKIEAGKLALECEKIDCHTAVEEVLASLRMLAERKGLQLSVGGVQSPLWVCANRRALNQVLLNLVANAIKFTPQGSVRLHLERLQGTQRPTVAFHVEDTGPGIPQEDQQKLFEAFSRIGADPNATPGTGLGLHLSRKLAELQGGRMTFRSELGAGSTFTLELPEQEE